MVDVVLGIRNWGQRLGVSDGSTELLCPILNTLRLFEFYFCKWPNIENLSIWTHCWFRQFAPFQIWIKRKELKVQLFKGVNINRRSPWLTEEPHKLFDYQWCAWDSNPELQDDRRRRIYWAMAAPSTVIAFYGPSPASFSLIFGLLRQIKFEEMYI